MKNTNNQIQDRRNKIMLICQNKGQVEVNELSEELNVSPLTIRRDLQYWEDNNAMIRHYGGAKLIQNYIENDQTLNSNEHAKHAIAKFAAQQVEDNDIIFINTSSTALLLLKYIKGKRVTAITNNGQAILINYDPLISVQLTGGEIRNPKEALVGDFALSNLSKVTADKAFLGFSGVSSKSGLTSAILPEVAINQMMINRCSGKTYALVDHTKIGLDHSYKSGSLNDVDYIITDTESDLETIYEIEEHGVKVVRLEPFKSILNIL